MSLRLLLEIIAFTSVVLWYVTGSVVVLKKRGFDPSLITFISPLSFKDRLGLRLILGINLIACLFFPLTAGPLFLTSLVTLGLALAQIILLLAFNRSATQPTLNYYLIALVGLLALDRWSFIFNLVYLGAVVVIQEYLLNHFIGHRQQKYDNWVERQVYRINRQHGSLRASLSDEEWFNTLHIAVTENIARPRLSRIGESLYFYVKRPALISSGIMQVQASSLLSDHESLKRGSQIVSHILKSTPADAQEPIDRLRWLAKGYSGIKSDRGIDKYTSFLLLTYPGLSSAWQKIARD